MDKELLIKGNKVFYRVEGAGNPVFLVHGFGVDGRIWNNQVAGFSQDPELTGKFKFIVPDLPGSGKSAIIEDMSMEGLAEMLLTILVEECGASKQAQKKTAIPANCKAKVIGHSMGGYITLAFAEKYPEWLNAFGLFHSSSVPDSEEKRRIRLKGIDFINAHGAYEFLKTSQPNLFSQKTKDERPELIDELIEDYRNFSDLSLVTYYRAMIERPDRTPVLKETSLPVLFILGEYDTALPLKDGLQLCHLPEKSYIHILRKSGHMGMVEEPEKSTQLLKDYLLSTST